MQIQNQQILEHEHDDNRNKLEIKETCEGSTCHRMLNPQILATQ